MHAFRLIGNACTATGASPAVDMGHTRAHLRSHHGFPSAPQRVPGCQHVALPLPAVVMQRLSRHRRLTTRQTRASERCCRRPGRRPKSCCARRPMQTLPPWPSLVLPARHRLPKADICIASRGGAAVEPPHGPQPAPSSSKATSKNAAQKVAVILRRPDLAVSGLREALCSSVSVPTRTAVAGGVVPAMTVLMWSPIDGTHHSDLLNRTQSRARF